MKLNPDIVSLQSSTSVIEQGIKIYAQIDQQTEASKSGLSLKPFQQLIFGNPKGGIPIMNANPLSGLDLPLKVLIWEENEKKVWLSYNKFKNICSGIHISKSCHSHIN